MPQVQLADGLNVHYERIGTGPDLVMVHGVIGHIGVWHFKIVPSLWDHYRILTYDLRGHGYTDMTETGYTPTQLAGDLAMLMDALEIERADIVGHSYGADVALYFTYLYPERVRKAVLIEPIVPAAFPVPTRAEFAGREWLADALDMIGVHIPEERRLDSAFMMQKAFETSNRWGPNKGMPRSKQHKEWIDKLFLETSVLKDMLDVGDLTIEQIATIQTPVHLIFGSGSTAWKQGFGALRDNLPNVTYRVISTGRGEMSHFAPLEKPETVIEELRQALA